MLFPENLKWVILSIALICSTYLQTSSAECSLRAAGGMEKDVDSVNIGHKKIEKLRPAMSGATDIASILAEKEDKVRSYIRQKEALAESLQSQLDSLQQDFLYNLDCSNTYKRQIEAADLENDSLRAALADRHARISQLTKLVQEKTGHIRNLNALRLEFDRAAKDTERRHQQEFNSIKLSLKDEFDLIIQDRDATIVQLEAKIKDSTNETNHQKYIHHYIFTW